MNIKSGYPICSSEITFRSAYPLCISDMQPRYAKRICILVVDIGYECPICLADEDKAAGRGGNSSTWVLDHNHDTDEFRGWLCHSCNRALGCFNDDVPRMQRAIKYIRGKLC